MRPKAQLEEQLRTSVLAATILRPVGYMENYLGQARGLRPDGILSSTSPPDLPEQLIATDDIGSFAALAFSDPDQWNGRELNIAGDELTTPDIAIAITEAIGREVRYEQIPLDSIRAENPQRAAAIARMWDADRPAANLKECRTVNPKLITFRHWLSTPTVAETLARYLTTAKTLQ